jgi:hypothetical protein
LASPTTDRSFQPEHRLAWTLLTLRACEKTGLHPISLRRFHRLTYFSNCLAQVYDGQPPSELVRKHEWGPYYPLAQFDIDQLVLMGLANVQDVSWSSTKSGTWKSGDFAISADGFELGTCLLGAGEWFADSYRFLLDLCAAYASLDDSTLDAAAELDLTYTQPGFAKGSVISFSDMHANLSARGAKAFADLAPPVAVPNRQHQLRLYMKFLEGRAA